MKTVVHFCCFFILILSTACKKNDAIPDRSNTFISAYNNSEAWISNEPYSSISKTDKIIWIGGYRTIETNTPGDTRLLLMQLEITDIANLKNTTIKNAFYESIIGGDVVIDRYTIDTTNANNKIEIIEIDEINKIIKGQFNLTLIRDSWFSGNGEQTEFTSGEFIVNYTEQ